MNQSILSQIKNLENMTIKNLTEKYHEVFGNGKGIQNNKAYFVKRIAYKIQENELGGVEQESKNEIRKLITEINPLQKAKSKIKTNLIAAKKH